eukprot:PhF_6_TR22424/c0_g2_i1/m.31823
MNRLTCHYVLIVISVLQLHSVIGDVGDRFSNMNDILVLDVNSTSDLKSSFFTPWNATTTQDVHLTIRITGSINYEDFEPLVLQRPDVASVTIQCSGSTSDVVEW